MKDQLQQRYHFLKCYLSKKYNQLKRTNIIFFVLSIFTKNDLLQFLYLSNLDGSQVDLLFFRLIKNKHCI